MLVSQQAKKFRIRNSLVLKPKTENSPEQNKLSSCFREENSHKSIFYSHSQFQFSNLHNARLSLFLLISPLRDLISFEKKNKASIISSARVDVWNMTELTDSANTYCMPRAVQGIGNTNINAQRAPFTGVPSAWNNLPLHLHLTYMCILISLNTFSRKAPPGSPSPALSPLNFVYLSSIHQACNYSFSICILLTVNWDFRATSS